MLKMTANKNKKRLGVLSSYSLEIPKQLYPKYIPLPLIINILVREAKTTKEG